MSRTSSTVDVSAGSSASVARPTLRIFPKSDTSAAPLLAMELAEHVLSAGQLAREDPARDGEELAHQRVAQGIARGGSVLLRRHHVVRPQHRQVLRDAGLVGPESDLELLDGAVALHQKLDETNPDGVGQR